MTRPTPERIQEIREQCMREWKPQIGEMRELLAEIDSLHQEIGKLQSRLDYINNPDPRDVLTSSEIIMGAPGYPHYR